MKLKIFKNFKELSLKAAEEVIKVVESHKKREIIPILLAGGTTILGMEKILAQKYIKKIDWQKIHLFWGDEHIVSKNHSKNNFGLALKELKFLEKVLPHQNIHPILTEDKKGVFDFKKAQKEAKRYSQLVKKILQQTKKIFPLVFLGIGDDFHTASILPSKGNFKNPSFESSQLFIAIDYPKDIYSEIQTNLRISLTLNLLLNFSEKVILLASGEKKSQALAEIIKKEPNIEKRPASIIKLVKKGFIFADKQAAKLLLES